MQATAAPRDLKQGDRVQLSSSGTVWTVEQIKRNPNTGNYVAHLSATRANGRGRVVIGEVYHPNRRVLVVTPDPVPRFDPDDCGGVWDGFQVTSDADPGF